MTFWAREALFLLLFQWPIPRLLKRENVWSYLGNERRRRVKMKPTLKKHRGPACRGGRPCQLSIDQMPEKCPIVTDPGILTADRELPEGEMQCVWLWSYDCGCEGMAVPVCEEALILPGSVTLCLFHWNGPSCSMFVVVLFVLFVVCCVQCCSVTHYNYIDGTCWKLPLLLTFCDVRYTLFSVLHFDECIGTEKLQYSIPGESIPANKLALRRCAAAALATAGYFSYMAAAGTGWLAARRCRLSHSDDQTFSCQSEKYYSK